MNMKDVKKINVPYDKPIYKILDYIKFSGAEGIVFTEVLNYRSTNYEIEFELDSSASNDTNYYPIGVMMVNYDGLTNWPTNCCYARKTTSNNNTTISGYFNAGNMNTAGQYYSITKTLFTNETGKVKLFWNKLEDASTNTYSYGFENIQVDTASRSGGLGRITERDDANLNGFMIGACLTISYNGSTYPRSYTGNFIGKIYSFKYNDGVTTYNMVPAQRISDNVCGLYDLDTGEFKAMAGTTITNAAAGSTVSIITTPTTPEVKKIEDSNGNIIWGSYDAYPYRKLSNIGWWCNDTSGDNINKGLWIPTDITYPLANNIDFTLAFQPYKSQRSYSPVVSNYKGNNQKGTFVINVNQSGNNCLTLVTSNNTTRVTTDLDSSAWNSDISTDAEQCIYMWSNQPNNNSIFMKHDIQNSLYTCDTPFYSTLGNQTTNTLSYKLYNNNPTDLYGLSFYVHPVEFSSTPNGQCFAGKFYRFQIYNRNTSAYIHDLVPAQRKSDNRVGLYDMITHNFYPDINNYQYNNYHLQIGEVLDEYLPA